MSKRREDGKIRAAPAGGTRGSFRWKSSPDPQTRCSAAPPRPRRAQLVRHHSVCTPIRFSRGASPSFLPPKPGSTLRSATHSHRRQRETIHLRGLFWKLAVESRAPGMTRGNDDSCPADSKALAVRELGIVPREDYSSISLKGALHKCRIWTVPRNTTPCGLLLPRCQPGAVKVAALDTRSSAGANAS